MAPFDEHFLGDVLDSSLIRIAEDNKRRINELGQEIARCWNAVWLVQKEQARRRMRGNS